MRRRAFTLIEMLVAIGIIVVLATLAVAVIPRLASQSRPRDGALQLQGWLALARQTPQRDQVAGGVRLIVDSDGYIRTGMYLSRPDNFVGQGGAASFDASTQWIPGNPTPAPFSQRIFLQGADITGGLTNPQFWPIQPGNFIRIHDGQAWVIKPEGYDPIAQRSSVLLQNPLADFVVQPPTPPKIKLPFDPTPDWAIDRAVAPVPGEPLLQLPKDVVINPAKCLPPITTPTLDIVFAKNGDKGDGQRLILWIQDVPLGTDPPLDQLLIVIFPDGRVGSCPVDPNSANPYSYALDPRASGF